MLSLFLKVQAYNAYYRAWYCDSLLAGSIVNNYIRLLLCCSLHAYSVGLHDDCVYDTLPVVCTQPVMRVSRIIVLDIIV